MADTIQEYLIGLGYKIDEPGLAKFNLFIGTTAKSFAALSATVATTTMQVVESVTRIAKQFESLYYASQRTGETVAGLQAVGFAAQQIGVSSQAAQGAIESFARAIRTNPGIEGLLKQLGVGPGSPMERLKQFIQNTQAMPYYIRAQYAGMLGMDEQTFRMMTLEGGFERFAREQEDFIRRQREAGIDAKALSEESVEFSRSWNRLSSDASIFGEVLSKNVLPILQKLVDFLDRVVQKVNSVFGDKAKSAASANKLSYYIEASNASFLHGLGLMSDDEYQKEIREIWGRQNAGGGPAGSVAAPPPAAGPAGGGAAQAAPTPPRSCAISRARDIRMLPLPPWRRMSKGRAGTIRKASMALAAARGHTVFSSGAARGLPNSARDTACIPRQNSSSISRPGNCKIANPRRDGSCAALLAMPQRWALGSRTILSATAMLPKTRGAGSSRHGLILRQLQI